MEQADVLAPLFSLSLQHDNSGKMNLKNKFEEYTESEFMSLINRLVEGNYSSEKEHDAIVDNIVSTSEPPNGTGILYYPDPGVEDSPAGVIEAIKQWRAANGKPGFKEG